MQEWLGFINSEVHKGFSPLFNPETPADYKSIALRNLANRFGFLASYLASHPYLMGEQFTVADGYLYTVLGWCQWVGTVSYTHLDVYKRQDPHSPKTTDEAKKLLRTLQAN